MKLKIVHLIASSALYGAEKWILALMRAMDSKKVESILINLADSENATSTVVTAARERGLDAQDFYTGGTFNPLCVMRFSRWLKCNNIDIVHGHGYKSDLIGLLAAKLANCKIISTPHGWSLEADKKLLFYEKLDRFTFRFMDYLCPLSEDLLKSVSHCVPVGKVRLIENGVDIDEVREVLAIKYTASNVLRIGYVGQLVERKNILTLVKSLKLLSVRGIKAKLIVVGDGPERDSLEDLASVLGVHNHVEFLGYRIDAIAIMKSLDVFVLPSLLEGIPRCVMEAMAAEIPVIVSDIPGNRELVKHRETGLIFPPLDEGALAEVLMFLIANSAESDIYVKKAYNLIMDKYSNQRMASEYSPVYSSLR